MKNPCFFLSAVFPLLFSLQSAAAVFETFEGDGFGDWKTTGSAFGLAPVHGKIDGMDGEFTGFSNDSFAASAHGGNAATGTLQSPEFTIKNPSISFLIAGGKHPGKAAAQLVIDGEVALETTGKDSLRFDPAVWDVSKFQGQKAIIRIVDQADGNWGFIAVDQFTFGKDPFTQFPAATKDGKPLGDGLIATDALPGVTIPPGSTLKVAADFRNQQLTSPTALTFDEQGNIYISETHRFRHGVEDDRDGLYWYLDDLKSMKTEDRRALHKKWEEKLSHEYMTEASELIRRLSDTDGDGTFDESTVFADGFNDVLDGTAAGVFYYDGALYFACIPKIYMLRDTDGDGVSDEKKVVEEGFGVRISLSGHDLNGFTLGPDGRIYGTVGDRGFSMVTKAGKELHYPNEGAIFRFEPNGTGFELMHTGLRNPKEIAFDELGDAFSVDNNSDQGDGARIVYLVEGGDSGWQMEHQTMHTFHRQIGLEERPPSRWMDEKMWELENDSQPAYLLPPSEILTSGPSGLTYHPGAGFLESEKGRFLICDYRGGAAGSSIWSFAMEPDGAGMKMTDARRFLTGIAATDVEYSFDGRVFVTDFVGGWESHRDGRLISLDAGENLYLPADTQDAAKLIAAGFDQRSSEDLAKLLVHADSRVRIRAQIALTRKADALQVFTKATTSKNQIERIHGIWGLGIVARRGSAPTPGNEFEEIPRKGLREGAGEVLAALLKDPDPEIRTQVLRSIGDAPIDGNSLPLGALLFDKNSRVAFAAGIAIGKMKAIGHYSAVIDFIRKNNNQDRYLRHAGVYALQYISTNPTQISALSGESSAALRLAAVVALRRLHSLEIGHFINDPDPQVQDEVIRAITDNDILELRSLAATLLDDTGKRTWAPFMLRRLIHAAYRDGTVQNASRLLRVFSNESLPAEVRKEALRLLENWEEPFPADQLTGHWRPLEPRPATTIKPALSAALPELLKKTDFVLTGALELVEKYEIGIDSLKDETLQNLIEDGNLPGEARAKALDLYIGRGADDVNSLLVKLADEDSDELALTALKALALQNPAEALPALEKAINSENASRAQAAWTILAPLPGADTADFIVTQLGKLQDAEGVSPSAIELLATAASRNEPEVAVALKAFEKAMAESEDPLAKFNISLQGGDPKHGFALFTSHPAGQCMRCHQTESGHAAGGDVGPNLAGIGKRHDRRYLLESIIDPGAVITPGYGMTAVTFKNGATLGGSLVAETAEYIDIATPEKLLRAKRSDVETVTPPVSAMPPMELLLKPEETRDLVAWLATLDSETEVAKDPREPEMIDPSTLPGAK